MAQLRRLPAWEEPEANGSPADHMANQRTLLAWVRTSVQIMALGIVVLQFIAKGQGGGTGHLVGIGLIALGGATAIFGGLDFVRNAGHLERRRYRPSRHLSLAVIAAVALAAVLIVAYVSIVR